jgi:hypothetical protein
MLTERKVRVGAEKQSDVTLNSTSRSFTPHQSRQNIQHLVTSHTFHFILASTLLNLLPASPFIPGLSFLVLLYHLIQFRLRSRHIQPTPLSSTSSLPAIHGPI